MAPVAHVLIYYVRDDGEIVADAMDVELEGTLQNFVDIKTVPDEVGPGDNVDITISAKPNSYVGILGVDQRSLLLKSGNDLSHVSINFPFISISFSRYEHKLNCVSVFRNRSKYVVN